MLGTSSGLFCLPFTFVVVILLIMCFVAAHIFHQRFSRVARLIGALTFLPSSASRVRTLGVHRNSTGRVVDVGGSVTRVGSTRVRQSGGLLSLVSCSRRDNFVGGVTVVRSGGGRCLTIKVVGLYNLRTIRTIFNISRHGGVIEGLYRQVTRGCTRYYSVIAFGTSLCLLLYQRGMRAFAHGVTVMGSFSDDFNCHGLHVRGSTVYRPLRKRGT